MTAANRWVFRDLDPDPWNGVRFVAVSGSPRAGHADDITDTFALGVASPREHRAYPAALSGETAEPEPFLRREAERAGLRSGGGLATTFEVLVM